MAYLLDTSILGRLANTADPSHAIAVQAILNLHRGGEIVHSTAQLFVEFRNAATRPITVNGLGMTIAEAESKAAQFESEFPLLAETDAIFPAWKLIIAQFGVIGKRVHDARLIAVCHSHSVTHFLTFNTRHFVQIATMTPGVVVVHPANV